MKNKKIRIQFIIITLFWGLLSCEEDGDRVEYNNDVGIEVYLQNDDNWDSGIEVLRNVDGGMDGIETSGPVFLKIDQNNLFCLFQEGTQNKVQLDLHR